MTGFTEADAVALEEAIASGARSVQRGDEKIEYRSLAEMETALARIRTALSGGTRVSRVRQMTPKTSRGF